MSQNMPIPPNPSARKLAKFSKAKKMVAGFMVAAVLTLLTPLASAIGIGDKVIPMGITVGITMKTDGVMVIGLTDTENKTGSPAKEAGIQPGDVIIQINQIAITCIDDINGVLSNCSDEKVTIKVVRSGKIHQFNLTPEENAGEAEIGVLLRDGMTGIGTVTFYDPETGTYGALGHAINDMDTGVLVPLKTGVLMRSAVTSIIPGQAGSPGQLMGNILRDAVIGDISQNTTRGIFGVLSPGDLASGKVSVPVASNSEIKVGPATILSNIEGTEVREYAIEITRLYSENSNDERNMMITVTDPELLKMTNGIVQGMSGSPILQDGKLVGAVTHVLISSPDRGYGISIEKMLETAYESERLAAA